MSKLDRIFLLIPFIFVYFIDDETISLFVHILSTFNQLVNFIVISDQHNALSSNIALDFYRHIDYILDMVYEGTILYWLVHRDYSYNNNNKLGPIEVKYLFQKILNCTQLVSELLLINITGHKCKYYIRHYIIILRHTH